MWFQMRPLFPVNKVVYIDIIKNSFVHFASEQLKAM